MSYAYEIIINNDKTVQNSVVTLTNVGNNLIFKYDCKTHQLFLHNGGNATIRWGYNGLLTATLSEKNITHTRHVIMPLPGEEMFSITGYGDSYFSTSGELDEAFNVIDNNSSMRLTNVTVYLAPTVETAVYSFDINNVAFENKNEIHIGVADVKYF